MKDRHLYHTTAWKKLRQAYAASRFFICERCGKVERRGIVHHKRYISDLNEDNPDVTLNWDNLEFLCRDCHNKEHFAEGEIVEDGLEFDENGQLIRRAQ